MIEKLSDNPNPEALAWLLEMELVSSPYVLNSIILNTFMSVRGVKDVEFVVDEPQKKLLVYIKLSWFYNKFKWKEIEAQVKDMLDEILPTFKKRVVFNREILEKALAIVQKKEQIYEQKPERPSAPAPGDKDGGR